MYLHITHSHTEFGIGFPGYAVAVRVTDAAGHVLADYGGPGTDADRPRYTPGLRSLGLVGRDDVTVTRGRDTVTHAWSGEMPLASLHPRVRTDIMTAWMRLRRLERLPSRSLLEAQRASVMTLWRHLMADGWSAEDAWYHARHCLRLAARVERAGRDYVRAHGRDHLIVSIAAHDAGEQLRWHADGAAALHAAHDVGVIQAMLRTGGCTDRYTGTASSAEYFSAA